MSAIDIKPEHIARWLLYVQRKRTQAGAHGLGLCENGHYDCAPVWNGTCAMEVTALFAGRPIEMKLEDLLYNVKESIDGMAAAIRAKDKFTYELSKRNADQYLKLINQNARRALNRP